MSADEAGVSALGASEASEILLRSSSDGGSAAAGTVVGVSGSVVVAAGARVVLVRHPVHGTETHGSLRNRVVDALAGNRQAIDFWRAVGFIDYSITFEMLPEREEPGE